MADSRHISETDLAWAAGFLDGEGCFTLLKRSGKNIHEVTRAVAVSAVQLKPEPIEKLCELLGGRVFTSRSPVGKITYRWEVTSAENVQRAITLVLPYLVNKKREAEIVLAYSKWMKRRGRAVAGATVYTFEEIEARRALIAELAEIRGAA